MIGLRRGCTVALHGFLRKGPHARAEITKHILAATGLDLDARTVATVGARNGHPEGIDVGFDLVFRRKAPARRAAQCGNHFLADRIRGERDRQRSPRAPEADALHWATAS